MKEIIDKNDKRFKKVNERLISKFGDRLITKLRKEVMISPS